MILRITAILFPIFAIVALGYWYGRRHDPEMAVANRLNMDIFVPALVFAALAGRTFAPAAACWRGRRRACSGCRGRPSYHR